MVGENMVTELRKSARLRNSELQSFGSSSVIGQGRSVCLRSNRNGSSEKVKRCDGSSNSGVGENAVTGLRKSARLMNLEFQSNGLKNLGASNGSDLIKCVSLRLTEKGDSTKVTRSCRLGIARIEEKVVGGMNKSAKSMDVEVGVDGMKDLEKDAPILSIVKGRGEKKRRKVVEVFEEDGDRRDFVEQLGVQGEIKDDGPIVEGISLRKNHDLHFGSSSGPKWWSLDQETALQSAYFIVKPSPSFWKEVAQMVPGKSAQECFDKINSTLLTPSPPCSRTKRKALSPLAHFQLPEHKLLEPFRPIGKNRKSSKQKVLLSQRTVRHGLRKHGHVDRENEADLFSILETMDPRDQKLPQIEISATPDSILKPCNSLHKSHERSKLPKVKNPYEQSYTSPEILKQVKNLALHEKYIDKLHCREAKRRAEKKSSVESCMQTTEAVRAARTALVLDAQDILMQFQQLQTESANDYDGFDDVGENEDNAE